jgi:hypothetical protein
VNKEKDLADFKNLLNRLGTEGKEFGKGDELTQLLSPERFPYKTRSIVQELVVIAYDNPEFSKLIPDNLKHFFLGYILPESEGKMNKAKRLMKLFEQKFKSEEEAIEQAKANAAHFGVDYYVNSTSDGIRVEKSPVGIYGVQYGNKTLHKVTKEGKVTKS